MEKQYEIEFKTKYDKYEKRMTTFQNNLTKAYGLLYGRCAKGMAQKIQARSDFISDIKGNPVKLIKAVLTQLSRNKIRNDNYIRGVQNSISHEAETISYK